jgi:O-antigen ligase
LKSIPSFRNMPLDSVDIRPMIHGVVGVFVRAGALLSVVFFLVKADIYLFVEGLLPVAPSTLFLIASMPLLYVLAIKCIHEKKLPPAVSGCRQVILPFAVLVVFSLVGILVRTPGIPPDMRPLFFPVLDFYVFFIGILFGSMRIHRSSWRTGMFLGLVVTIVTVVIDVIRPHTFTLEELEGASGLAQNPNGGAFVALLLMACALDWEKPTFKWRDVLVVVLAFIAIFLTASRSGILAAGIVGLVYLVRTWKAIRAAAKIKTASIFVFFFILLVSASYFFVESGPVFDDESTKFSRLLDMDAEILRFGDSASLERLDAVDRSLRIISERIVLGMGTGYIYSMPVGPHNMYLARWVDNGVIGLFSYLWLISAAFVVNWRNRNTEGVVIAFVVIFFGFFSHNVLEDRTILLLLAISTAAGAASIEGSARPSS